jgi:response regulator of citrate/malate metabolism
LVKAEKITSSRLRQQVQRQVRVQQQVLQQLAQEQQRVQEELLFYRKRPKQQPTKLPRGVIFSWGFLKEWFEKFRGMPHALVNNRHMQPSRWTQAPSTQPFIIGEFPNGLFVSFLSLFR